MVTKPSRVWGKLERQRTLVLRTSHWWPRVKPDNSVLWMVARPLVEEPQESTQSTGGKEEQIGLVGEPVVLAMAPPVSATSDLRIGQTGPSAARLQEAVNPAPNVDWMMGKVEYQVASVEDHQANQA